MACQKAWKQGRDDIIVKVNLQSPIPTLQLQTGVKVKTMQGWGFVYLPSLLYHPYLVFMLFGMPSLHLFTFVMFFKSCVTMPWIRLFRSYLLLVSQPVGTSYLYSRFIGDVPKVWFCSFNLQTILSSEDWTWNTFIPCFKFWSHTTAYFTNEVKLIRVARKAEYRYIAACRM